MTQGGTNFLPGEVHVMDWLDTLFLTHQDVVATCSRNKLTQKNNADSGVQFITLAGPRQSLLLAKDPNQF